MGANAEAIGVKLVKGKYNRVLTLVLVVQAALLYTAVSHAEFIPSVSPLSVFPVQFEGWRSTRVFPIDKDTLDVLKADDTLNREYVNSAYPEDAYLFIAFFKSQRFGQSPHSPKNCLPGSGWDPVSTGTISIDVPGRAEPLVANRYVVAHGDEKSLVIYWYQSHNRFIASEYSAKFWLVADSIRLHRSDTALVRVVVPVHNGHVDAAEATGVQFVKSLFSDLVKQLPS